MKRIAIIGLGSIGLRHAENLLSMGYTDLCAVDARPFPKETRFPVLNDIRAVGRWNPTHVLVCTPPEQHYIHAVRFLASAIPVFIEKPITTNTSDARALCALAKREKVALAVGYMERAHPAVIDAREWFLENHATDVEVVCYWKATKKTYELNVIAESSHAIDTAISIIGKPDSVMEYKDCKTSTQSHVRLLSGVHSATVLMDMNCDPARSIAMHSINGGFFEKQYGLTSEEWDDCYKAELQAFLDGKPLCTGQDGLAVVEVMEHLTNGISYA